MLTTFRFPMNKQNILNVILLLCGTITFAQDYTITGKVINATQQPIPYVTVLLTNADGAEVDGLATTTDGVFTFKSVAEGKYSLNFSYIGYAFVTRDIEITADLNVGTIVLEEDTAQLEAVTVTGKVPTVKKMADRTVFNVGNTSLANGSVWNVLQKTPQVIILNNNLTVKGQSPTVYINNRKVYLSASELQTLLEGTAANSIQSVEVITNPSAKYDAEDAIVVNINMTKNLITGYNGSLTADYTQGIYPKFSLGTGHFYKTDKLNVYLGYTYNKKKIDRVTSEFVQYYTEKEKDGYWESDLDLDTWEEDHTVTTNIDYDLSKKSSLSFSANAQFTPYWERDTKSNTIAYNQTGVIDSTFYSLNNTRDTKNNVALNLGYTYAIDDAGQQLSVLAHHTYYDYSRNQGVRTNYFNASGGLLNTNDFTSDQNQEIAIYTGQIDYELPLPKNMNLEAGVKGVSISADSDLLQQSVSGNVPLLNLDNTYNFRYDEYNLAGYVNGSKNWDKWSIRMGIRSEYTNAEGTAANPGDNNSFDYLKWFPSFSTSYTPNYNHSFTLGYKKSITRPGYKRLNPFRFYLNDNSFVTGNSQLLPAVKHYANIDYTFKSAYTVSLFYKHVKNPMAELSFQENDNRKMKYVADNLDSEESYGIDFYVSKPISNRWYMYFESSTFYNKLQFFAVENGNQLVNNNQWTGWLFLGNYFTLLNDNSLTADVTYLYVLPANDANAEVTQRNYLSIGLNKSIWNNRASISLQANDIFNGQIFTSTTQYLNQYNSYRSRFENRTIMLGFKYKFGNYRLRNNKKNIDVEERDRL